jgi:DNA-directed RNA polymerase subunit RPC12/RpoP
MNADSPNIVMVEFACGACGKSIEAECQRLDDRSPQTVYAVDCPHCEERLHSQLPGPVLQIYRAGELEDSD